MKRGFAFLLVLILTVALTACSSSNSGSSSGSNSSNAGNDKSGKVTQIRMQIAWASDSDRGKAIQRILDQFEKKNPNIKVKLVGSSQSNQKLLTQILSGQAPEVMMVAYQDIKALAPQGAFTDLTKQLGGMKDNYYQNSWNQAVVNGNLYGLPWLGHSIQLLYNKDMFKKAGIQQPPKNWQELYQDAKKLTIDKNGDGKPDQFGIGLVGEQTHDISWLVDMFLHQAGAKLVKKDANGNYQVAVDSPQAKKALAFYKKLADQVAQPNVLTENDGQAMEDFRNQQVAMYFNGPWGVTDVWQNGNKFKVGVAPAPAGPAGKAADVATYMLSVPKGIKGDKLNASMKLIKYLGSKPAQEMLLKGVEKNGKYYPFRIPIRKDLANAPFLKKHPEFQVFIQGLQYPSTSNPIPAWQKIDDSVYQSALNQVVSGKISVEQGLKMITKRGNKILQQQGE